MKDKLVSSGSDETPSCQLKELIAFLVEPEQNPYPRKCLRFPGPLSLSHVFFINIYQHADYVPSQKLESLRYDAIRILESGIFTPEGELKGARLSGRYRLHKVDDIGELALMVALLIRKITYLDLIDDDFHFPDSDYYAEESEKLFYYLKYNKLANSQRIARIEKENAKLLRLIKKTFQNIERKDEPVEGGQVLLLLLNVINTLDSYYLWFPDMFSSVKARINKMMNKMMRLRIDVFNQLKQLNTDPFYAGLDLIPHAFKRQIPSAPDNIIAKRSIELLRALGIEHELTIDTIRYNLRKSKLQITLHVIAPQLQ